MKLNPATVVEPKYETSASTIAFHPAKLCVGERNWFLTWNSELLRVTGMWKVYLQGDKTVGGWVVFFRMALRAVTTGIELVITCVPNAMVSNEISAL